MVQRPSSFVALGIHLFVDQLSFSIWEQNIISKEKGALLIKKILSTIDKDRNGEFTNGKDSLDCVQSLITCCDSFSLYEEEFEKPLIQETHFFYSKQASQAITSMQLFEYMKFVNYF